MISGAGNPAEGLKLLTANSTTWARLRDFLETGWRGIVLAQETHLLGEPLAEAQRWTARNGWRGEWAAAEPGEGAGSRGGVAVLAPSHVGIRAPAGTTGALHPGRAVAAHISAGPPGGMVGVSVYLRTGEDWSDDNRAIFRDIAEFVGSLACPWVLGGTGR